MADAGEAADGAAACEDDAAAAMERRAMCALERATLGRARRSACMVLVGRGKEGEEQRGICRVGNARNLTGSAPPATPGISANFAWITRASLERRPVRSPSAARWISEARHQEAVVLICGTEVCRYADSVADKKTLRGRIH